MLYSAILVTWIERRESAAVVGAAGAQLMTETVTDTSDPVLLYDGLCGFCSKGVQRILRYDKRKTMLFTATLRSTTSPMSAVTDAVSSPFW